MKCRELERHLKQNLYREGAAHSILLNPVNRKIYFPVKNAS